MEKSGTPNAAQLPRAKRSMDGTPLWASPPTKRVGLDDGECLIDKTTSPLASEFGNTSAGHCRSDSVKLSTLVASSASSFSGGDHTAPIALTPKYDGGKENCAPRGAAGARNRHKGDDSCSESVSSSSSSSDEDDDGGRGKENCANYDMLVVGGKLVGDIKVDVRLARKNMLPEKIIWQKNVTQFVSVMVEMSNMTWSDLFAKVEAEALENRQLLHGDMPIRDKFTNMFFVPVDENNNFTARACAVTGKKGGNLEWDEILRQVVWRDFEDKERDLTKGTVDDGLVHTRETIECTPAFVQSHPCHCLQAS